MPERMILTQRTDKDFNGECVCVVPPCLGCSFLLSIGLCGLHQQSPWTPVLPGISAPGIWVEKCLKASVFSFVLPRSIQVGGWVVEASAPILAISPALLGPFSVGWYHCVVTSLAPGPAIPGVSFISHPTDSVSGGSSVTTHPLGYPDWSSLLLAGILRGTRTVIGTSKWSTIKPSVLPSFFVLSHWPIKIFLVATPLHGTWACMLSLWASHEQITNMGDWNNIWTKWRCLMLYILEEGCKSGAPRGLGSNAAYSPLLVHTRAHQRSVCLSKQKTF